VCYRNNVHELPSSFNAASFCFPNAVFSIYHRGERKGQSPEVALRKGCKMSRSVQGAEEEGTRISNERRAALKICRNSTVASGESRCERSRAKMGVAGRKAVLGGVRRSVCGSRGERGHAHCCHGFSKRVRFSKSSAFVNLWLPSFRQLCFPLGRPRCLTHFHLNSFSCS